MASCSSLSKESRWHGKKTRATHVRVWRTSQQNLGASESYSLYVEELLLWNCVMEEIAAHPKDPRLYPSGLAARYNSTGCNVLLRKWCNISTPHRILKHLVLNLFLEIRCDRLSIVRCSKIIWSNSVVQYNSFFWESHPRYYSMITLSLVRVILNNNFLENYGTQVS